MLYQSMAGYICTPAQSNNTESVFHTKSRAVSILAGSSVVEVRAPCAIVAVLHVVAVGLLGEGSQPLGGAQLVAAVHHLDVLEVACLAEPFLREVPAAHLRRRVRAVRLRVHHLAAPLDHRRAVGEVGEEEGRPVAQDVLLAKLHPPVPFLRILRTRSRRRAEWLLDNSSS
jgi:hypothetical protein